MVVVRWLVLVAVLLAAASRARGEPLDEGLYAELLERHTRAVADTAGTRVDYAALRHDPDWERLLRNLSRVQPDALANREERLAFWINAYNILAIDLVRQHYPVESIRDLGSFWSPVWDREVGRIGGSAYSLGRIEHEILRPMGEPRIHMAIVCASVSCPSLRREPFSAARLDVQLADASRRFLANPGKGLRVEPGGVGLSRIFQWFESDFAAGGGVLAFVRRYAPPSARASLAADPAIHYLDYDWRLNDLG
jgi:hypothetical protein